MILFIKHIDIEGPDIFEGYFRKRGLSTGTVELYNNGALPENLDQLDAVISLGGPMNVYEEEQYPYLKTEDRFIKNVISRNIPFIGVCLGSQLLAKACGARVGRSPEKEIGFFPVRVNEFGVNDPLFRSLDSTINVFHWHEDMWELPEGAALLASSEGCPHQAYRVGESAYGLQFHMEVTLPAISKWTDAYLEKDPSFQKRKDMIVGEYIKQQKTFESIAETMNNNFLNIIKARKKQKQQTKGVV